MPPPDANFTSLFVERTLGAPHEFFYALHHVMQAEKPGSWPRVLAPSGTTLGKNIATALDQDLARRGEPALGEQPLEACVALLERHFATHGWGVLKLDLSEAGTTGLVLAKVEHSYFVEVLHPADHFTDSLTAGLLQGFFEHVSGQQLLCLEIACAARGAPHCQFVIGAPEQLAPALPLAGRTAPEVILAKLRG